MKSLKFHRSAAAYRIFSTAFVALSISLKPDYNNVQLGLKKKTKPFSFFQVLGRTIRVDHVSNYKPPKDVEKLDEDTKKLRKEGCAPKSK